MKLLLIRLFLFDPALPALLVPPSNQDPRFPQVFLCNLGFWFLVPGRYSTFLVLHHVKHAHTHTEER